MQTTLQEPTSPITATRRLLSHVLFYDDLMAAPGARLCLDDVAGPLTLGRAGDGGTGREGALLRIADPWMSSEHAVLERRGDATIARDLGSRNGTWVNGARASEHRLADGDLVEVGHSLFCFREVAEPLATALDDCPRVGPTPTACPEVAALARDLSRVAASAEPVLVLAPTGAGKEIVAGALHELSGRRGKLRAVDCGAVPDSLFEATFFGHKKGAFTGAEQERSGEIRAAHRGTLFLDEVANLSETAQAKLLRALETGDVTPVGGDQAERVDVRWVAATNRDLLSPAPGDAPFREDLLRRLAGFVARLPALRRRREDLGVLSAYLLRQAGIDKASITPAAGRALFTGPLPGNIRQLRTTLRAAALLAAGAPIELGHLPPLSAAEPAEAGEPAPRPADGGERATPTAAELAEILRETGGNVVRTAERLGTHPRQVYRWIERHKLSLDEFR